MEQPKVERERQPGQKEMTLDREGKEHEKRTPVKEEP